MLLAAVRGAAMPPERGSSPRRMSEAVTMPKGTPPQYATASRGFQKERSGM